MNNSIDFSKLNYTFKDKPLLFGGKALEFHGIRKAGKDIDFVISKDDTFAFSKQFPENLKDLAGDFGISIYEFEFWKTVNHLDYSFYKKSAVENENIFIVSLDKLLLIAAYASHKQKYLRDTKKIAQKIASKNQIPPDFLELENTKITDSIKNYSYLEKIWKLSSDTKFSVSSVVSIS